MDGHDEARELFRVGADRDIALRDAASSAINEALAQDFTLVGQTRLRRHETARGRPLVRMSKGAQVEHFGHALLKCRQRQRFLEIGADTGEVTDCRGLEQFILVSERRIEARRGDSHRFGQLSDGCGFEAVAPKLFHGNDDRRLTVECSRSTSHHFFYSIAVTT